MSFQKPKMSRNLKRKGAARSATAGKPSKSAMPDLTAAIAEISEAIAKLQEIGKSDQGLVASGQETPSLATGHQPLATPPTGEEIVTYLRTMFEELQILFGNFAELLPQLENTTLNATDRRRLNGSGVRRYGFIEKVFEVSGDFPQFWPPFGEGRKEMNQYVNEIDVLRNLLIWFRHVARVVQDLLLIAGDNAFRVAGAYYTFAREGARQKNPEAAQVFDMLRLFWKRPRRSNGEPTEKELERDFNAVMHGTKDGTVSVSNESDQMIKGKRVVIDHTYRKPRGGARVVERREVE